MAKTFGFSSISCSSYSYCGAPRKLKLLSLFNLVYSMDDGAVISISRQGRMKRQQRLLHEPLKDASIPSPRKILFGVNEVRGRDTFFFWIFNSLVALKNRTCLFKKARKSCRMIAELENEHDLFRNLWPRSKEWKGQWHILESRGEMAHSHFSHRPLTYQYSSEFSQGFQSRHISQLS